MGVVNLFRHYMIPMDVEYTAGADKAECTARYFESKCSLGQDDLPAPFPYVRPRNEQAPSDGRFRVAAVERTLWQ